MVGSTMSQLLLPSFASSSSWLFSPQLLFQRRWLAVLCHSFFCLLLHRAPHGCSRHSCFFKDDGWQYYVTASFAFFCIELLMVVLATVAFSKTMVGSTMSQLLLPSFASSSSWLFS